MFSWRVFEGSVTAEDSRSYDHVDPDHEREKQCLDLLVAMVKPWLG